MNGGLPAKTLEQLISIFRVHPIEKVVLFGSRARGTNSATSDIDLAVYAPEMTHRQISLLSEDMDESDMIYRFDLVHVSVTVDPYLRANIEKEGQVIYRSTTGGSHNKPD